MFLTRETRKFTITIVSKEERKIEREEREGEREREREKKIVDSMKISRNMLLLYDITLGGRTILDHV